MSSIGFIDGAAMPGISRVIMITNCCTASTDVTTFMHSETMFPWLEAIKGAINDTGLRINLCESNDSLFLLKK